MPARIVLVVAVLALAACASDDTREWMKLNQTYTVQEFRRDHAECSKSGKLDEACMRDRGWVDVSARKAPDKPLPSDRPVYGVTPRP